MKRILYLIIIIAAAGCREHKLLTSVYEINNEKHEEIEILAEDGTVYRLDKYHIINNKLEGEGKIIKNSHIESFKGEIDSGQIRYIIGSDFSIFRGLISAAIVGGISYAAVNSIKGDSKSVMNSFAGPHYVDPGPSCPEVFSWNGSTYVLDAEAIGTCIGRGLEGRTLSRLPSLKKTDEGIKFEIQNNRPETHYIDHVKLYAYEMPANATVIADPENNVFPVYTEIQPIKGRDNSGREVLNQISAKDDIYWQSEKDINSFRLPYTDEIELTFPNPDRKSEISIVIDGITAPLPGKIIYYVYDFLGSESINFISELDQNGRLQEKLKEYIHDSWLKVYVDGDYAGMITGEANKVSFTRMIRAKCKGKDRVEVKLKTLKDMWYIDQVYADLSSASSITPHEMKLKNYTSKIFSKDHGELSVQNNKYAVLLPGDKISFEYSYPDESGNNDLFFVEVSGYLYEWIPEPVNKYSYANDVNTGRLDLMKRMMNNRELTLEFVYSKWKGEVIK